VSAGALRSFRSAPPLPAPTKLAIARQVCATLSPLGRGELSAARGALATS
jgi:hypothetical protein